MKGPPRLGELRLARSGGMRVTCTVREAHVGFARKEASIRS